MKILLVVCDGLGDRPIKELNYKTPLAAAEKPNLEKLSLIGVKGIMDTVAPGVRPGSAPAHLAIFGYDPEKYYTGRGVFEALGLGLELKEGDIVFRFNFATVDDKMVVVDRRAGRISERTVELAKALNDISIQGVELVFKEAVEHRGVLIMRGEGLSWKVSDTDPGKTGLRVGKCKPLDSSPEALKTASLVDMVVEESYKILKDHWVNRDRIKQGVPPANVVLPRGASILTKVEGFKERYKLKASCVAGGTLYKGVAKFAGMNVLNVAGATGTYETNYKAKVEASLKALKETDFVFLHFKQADLAGEDGDYKRKIEVIQRIDEALKPLTVLDDTLIVVTADHSTPCSIKTHSADPVPVMICGEEVRRDCIEGFDEVKAAKGGLNRIRGLDLIRILLDIVNLAEKYGA
ncbi:2,3-bisphosphoglycerate-independent phosphoglycerate mutase [Candidatus Bathyarchaeota archaeon]|nr:2,3-bisphosphoglycerate-independent phosphoglycerate mutase [Candidatus Bathyarchaeota archaeon]